MPITAPPISTIVQRPYWCSSKKSWSNNTAMPTIKLRIRTILGTLPNSSTTAKTATSIALSPRHKITPTPTPLKKVQVLAQQCLKESTGLEQAQEWGTSQDQEQPPRLKHHLRANKDKLMDKEVKETSQATLNHQPPTTRESRRPTLIQDPRIRDLTCSSPSLKTS